MTTQYIQVYWQLVYWVIEMTECQTPSPPHPCWGNTHLSSYAQQVFIANIHVALIQKAINHKNTKSTELTPHFKNQKQVFFFEIILDIHVHYTACSYKLLFRFYSEKNYISYYIFMILNRYYSDEWPHIKLLQNSYAYDNQHHLL